MKYDKGQKVVCVAAPNEQDLLNAKKCGTRLAIVGKVYTVDKEIDEEIFLLIELPVPPGIRGLNGWHKSAFRKSSFTSALTRELAEDVCIDVKEYDAIELIEVVKQY